MKSVNPVEWIASPTDETAEEMAAVALATMGESEFRAGAISPVMSATTGWTRPAKDACHSDTSDLRVEVDPDRSPAAARTNPPTPAIPAVAIPARAIPAPVATAPMGIRAVAR